MTTVTHHDLHHAHARYNLGLYFSWWDRLMKTEHPQYHESYAQTAPRLSRARLGIVGLIVALVAGFLADRAQAFDLSGSYASPGLGVVVRFEDCPSDKVATCGRLLWVWDQADTPHARVGDLILTGLKFNGDVWEGQLRDPETGRVYRGTIQSASAVSLKLRGCAGIFCASQTWHSMRHLHSVLGRLDP